VLSQSSLLHKSCPLCGSKALKHRWGVNGYTIVRCGDCSLVFVQNILSREELAAYYASSGDQVYSDDNSELLNYYYNILRDRINAAVSRPGKIFDVGCSGGWFLEAMKGWECYGCEIASADAEKARRKFGDRIFPSTLEEYPEVDDFFDVITLQDVFDHLSEPLPALAKCHRMLKEGGLLVIKVHNISCLYAKLTGAGFYAIIPPSHLFYYNRRTLVLAAEKSGFEVVETKFIGHLLRISTVFMRLSRGNKKSLFYQIYSALADNSLGRIKIKKNLHDIITMFAAKRRGQDSRRFKEPSPHSSSR
jgi:SAM-dependent methyltransferase